MADDDSDEVSKLPPDARLESLDERLDRLQQEEAKRNRRTEVDPNMRISQVVIGYLIGGPLGGGLIGYGLDAVLGTRPWLTLVMLFLGFVVGIRNVLRISRITPSQGSDSKT